MLINEISRLYVLMINVLAIDFETVSKSRSSSNVPDWLLLVVIDLIGRGDFEFSSQSGWLY